MPITNTFKCTPLHRGHVMWQQQPDMLFQLCLQLTVFTVNVSHV